MPERGWSVTGREAGAGGRGGSGMEVLFVSFAPRGSGALTLLCRVRAPHLPRKRNAPSLSAQGEQFLSVVPPEFPPKGDARPGNGGGPAGHFRPAARGRLPRDPREPCTVRLLSASWPARTLPGHRWLGYCITFFRGRQAAEEGGSKINAGKTAYSWLSTMAITSPRSHASRHKVRKARAVGKLSSPDLTSSSDTTADVTP